MREKDKLHLQVIPEQIARSPERQRQSGMFHTRYKEELRLFACVREGDTRQLFQAFTGLAQNGIFVGEMSGNDLRQSQYMAVSAITLAIRAAIQGGLSEAEAYAFSDESIRAIDRARDGDAVLQTLTEQIFSLTERVCEAAKRLRYPPHVRECIRYVQQHLYKKITVADVAASCGLSADYISRLFKRATGDSLSRYIQIQKIQAAERLLRDGMEVKQVCEVLSFCSQSHFISVFKKITGMTPHAFILQNK